ncbi:MAG: hypothetical protein JRN26_04875 [Nitrososphaerota archaeon]|nr:hypothetical protein [Nitrososphaerota archaeon]
MNVRPGATVTVCVGSEVPAIVLMLRFSPFVPCVTVIAEPAGTFWKPCSLSGRYSRPVLPLGLGLL